jgi:hypothetical protein
MSPRASRRAAKPSGETETIARVAHLLAHTGAQLPLLAAGENTFEAMRDCYTGTTAALAQKGLSRVTAPRSGVGRANRYWSSVRDLIREFQNLGWIEPGIPVPSTKEAVDGHRDRRYPLTPEGRAAADVASDRRALADLLTVAAIAHHPYLRALLATLREGPVFCPEITIGDVKQKLGSAHWGEVATGLLDRSDPLAGVEPSQVATDLQKALARRFGRHRGGLPPTEKELQEATNDALAGIALSARELRFGATTLDALKSLGKELRLIDESRYVPGHGQGNMIWLACDLEVAADGTPTAATRKTFTNHGESVARAFVDTYFELREAERDEQTRREPTALPIHPVRAGAAFKTGTAREVGDRALEALAAGSLDLGVSVRPLSARFEKPPTSEPIYSGGGTRCLLVSINRSGDDPPEDVSTEGGDR